MPFRAACGHWKATIPYFFANATLQYSSSSTNCISEMELCEAIDSDLQSHKGLFCHFTCQRLDFSHLTLLMGTSF